MRIKKPYDVLVDGRPRLIFWSTSKKGAVAQFRRAIAKAGRPLLKPGEKIIAVERISTAVN